MKNVFIVIVCLLCTSLYAQEDLELIREKAKSMGFTIEDTSTPTSKISFVKIFEPKSSQNASQLYNKIEAYFTYTYNKGDYVIEVRNAEEKYIIGNGAYPNFHKKVTGWGYSLLYRAEHILRVDCKDNKVRVIITIPNYIEEIKDGGTGLITGRSKKPILTIGYPINPNDAPEKPQRKRTDKTNYHCFKGVVLAVENHFKQIEEVINKGNSILENQDW